MRQFGNIGSLADLTEAQQGNDTLLTLDSHDSVLLKYDRHQPSCQRFHYFVASISPLIARRRSFPSLHEKVLVQTLRHGDIVIVDNLGSHKVNAMRHAIRAAGARFFYLPKYSPDLNPIEQFFTKLKHWLRKAAQRTTEAVYDAIADQRQPRRVTLSLYRVAVQPSSIAKFVPESRINRSVRPQPNVLPGVIDGQAFGKQNLCKRTCLSVAATEAALPELHHDQNLNRCL